VERIPWERPRGALHDLAHYLDIDEGARSVLLLSDRTLYLVQNWAALDLAMRARWIAEGNEFGYLPPEPGSDDDAAYLAAVELAQEELTPMPAWESGLWHDDTSLAGSGTPQEMYWQPDDEAYEYRLDAIQLVIVNRVPTNMVLDVGQNNTNYVRLAEWPGGNTQTIFVSPGLVMPGTDLVLRGRIWGQQSGDTVKLQMYYSRRLPLSG
jgi:hypothetical protein